MGKFSDSDKSTILGNIFPALIILVIGLLVGNLFVGLAITMKDDCDSECEDESISFEKGEKVNLIKDGNKRTIEIKDEVYNNETKPKINTTGISKYIYPEIDSKNLTEFDVEDLNIFMDKDNMKVSN